MSRTRLVRLALVTVAAGAAAACGPGGSGSAAASRVTVGIALPTRTAERWVTSGRELVARFTAAGYRTDLQYGDNVVDQQIGQIENMIVSGDRLLVVTPVDGSALTAVLQQAKAKGIRVLSYDGFLRGTDAVDAYVAYDQLEVGRLQGSSIVQALGLAGGRGPFTLELFAGSPDDDGARSRFRGATAVLQPYLDRRQLVVRSGQTTYDQAATLRGAPGVARQRMHDLLGTYAGARIDAVLSPSDGISLGIASALSAAGYGTPDRPLPVLTGQGADLASVKAIAAGRQTSSVDTDPRRLADAAVQVGQAVLGGAPAGPGSTPAPAAPAPAAPVPAAPAPAAPVPAAPTPAPVPAAPTPAPTTYANGAAVVPAVLLQPVPVDRTNYRQVLLDSGRYTSAQLGG